MLMRIIVVEKSWCLNGPAPCSFLMVEILIPSLMRLEITQNLESKFWVRLASSNVFFFAYALLLNLFFKIF